MVKSIKIIFAGLDAGGKTSICEMLKQKRYAIDELKPTKGINRLALDIMDCRFTEWDLGGQEKYRRTHLENEETFYNTDLVFFVIDISDSERFLDAIDYLKSIIEILKTHDLKPPIVIMLNKSDKTEQIMKEKVQSLQNSILAISKEFEIEFFRTSIFDPQSLMNAFSHGIIKIAKKTSELSSQLKEMATETFADAVLLVESNGFIIGEYFGDEKSRNMCMAVYNNLIGAFSFMYKTLIESEKPERILIDWEDQGYAFLGSTEIENSEFFFIKYSKNPRKVVQKFVLRSLIESSKQIRSLIKSYFE